MLLCWHQAGSYGNKKICRDTLENQRKCRNHPKSKWSPPQVCSGRRSDTRPEWKTVVSKWQVLITRRWEKKIDYRRDLLQSIPVWIRLFLPTHLWTSEALGRCACVIGKPIFVDPATAARPGSRFARICVGISARDGFLIRA